VYTFLVAVEILLAVMLITVIMLQPSKADGLKGFITGNKETFFSKNKSRTREVVLERLTIAFSILFAALTLVLNIMSK
jgi:preprotein translocase subunit SecG